MLLLTNIPFKTAQMFITYPLNIHFTFNTTTSVYITLLTAASRIQQSYYTCNTQFHASIRDSKAVYIQMKTSDKHIKGDITFTMSTMNRKHVTH